MPIKSDFEKHFNNLTPAEAERLAFLFEECAEVIVAIGKIFRHGYESYDPTLPAHEQVTNRQMLEVEMGDVRAAMIMLCNAEDTTKSTIHWHAEHKLTDVKQWMHHQ